MNPDKQRIAIARACGWENSQTDSKTCYNPHGEHGYWSDVPDYLNDLNAMAEAEKSAEMIRCHVQNYRQALQSIRGTQWGFATAAQRAEAFLRTLGKWEEDK